MLVHAGVSFAFLSAGLAGGGAGLQNGAGDVCVVAGVAGEDVPGGGADVGAVKVRADAFSEFGDHVFTEAGIRASCTGLGAFKTSGDAIGQLLTVNAP